MSTSELVGILTVFLGGNGIISYLIQYSLSRRDKRQEKDDLVMQTLSLQSYCNLKQEIVALLDKAWAAESERRFLYKMYDNYKAHGWNGDMDAMMRQVDELPYAPPGES